MPCLMLEAARGRPEKVFPLHRRVTSVGSGPENEIRVEGSGVAKNHAHLFFDGKEFSVQTLDRKARVMVNGKARKQSKLTHGDVIKLGNLSFKFSLYDPPQVGGAASAQAEIEHYRRVYEFTRQLAENPSLPELLENLIDQSVEITGADKGFLILFAGDEYDFRVARNLKGEKIPDAIDQVSDTIIGNVVESGKPLLISDALSHEEFNSSVSVLNLKVSSVLCAPLLDRGEAFGILYLGNDNVINLFDERALEVLEIFAAQASLIIRNALQINELRLSNEALREQVEQSKSGQMVSACEGMRRIFSKIRKVAPTDVSVLVTGETGTGKELVAREIHNSSSRAKGPFIAVNCGAIPENLLESELFGHVRGAFTGAVSGRAGKFKAADGGTLFLDEIGEMPANLQVKILRALEERTVTRVGDSRPEPVDIRVIAATNRDLETEIAEKRFREDLFYRLNVVSLALPALRDRGEDAALLAKYFLDRANDERAGRSKRLSPASLAAIRKHAWPGNIRELENRIRKAVVLSDGPVIAPDDLDLDPSDLPPILPLNDAREEFTRRYINDMLERNNGNRTQTARDLGVDPRTIFRYLEKERSSEE